MSDAGKLSFLPSYPDAIFGRFTAAGRDICEVCDTDVVIELMCG